MHKNMNDSFGLKNSIQNFLTEQKIEIFGYLERHECEVSKRAHMSGSKLYLCRTYVAELTEDFQGPMNSLIIPFKQKESEITATNRLK